MKIWAVPLNELDTDRLFAFHTDWHILARDVRIGREYNGWESPHHVQAFADLHTMILGELCGRGIDTKGLCLGKALTLHFPRPEEQVMQVPYKATPEQVALDRWELLCRWGGTFKGQYVTARDRAAWDILIARYRTEGGCKHDGGRTAGGKCVVCKKVRFNGVEWVPLPKKLPSLTG